MAETAIEWTGTRLADGTMLPGYTFNPWWGCQRVSPGCEHCYAEAFDHRLGRADWGVKAPRRFFNDAHWAQPLKWNARARKLGVRLKVFCASMADVFEDRDDLWPHRERLARLIEATPWLDWLLLTKRVENAAAMLARMFPGGVPSNVWLGVTVEDQRRADERIPILLRAPVAVYFLSVEPLLSDVTLWRFDEDERAWRGPGVIVSGGMTAGTQHDPPEGYDDSYVGIDWVIVGGESGHGSRPFDLAWARSIVAQCKAAEVACFVKQLGDNPHGDWGPNPPMVHVTDITVSPPTQRLEENRFKNGRWRLTAKKGGWVDEFPDDLRVREFPAVQP